MVVFLTFSVLAQEGGGVDEIVCYRCFRPTAGPLSEEHR